MSQIFTQTQSTILNDLQLLNSQDQQTVLDFIHFLVSKHQTENIENSADKLKEVSFYEATKEFAGHLDWGAWRFIDKGVVNLGCVIQYQS
jgi:hypothetical protein